jgi:16S rRNA (guanine(966)-N(2))-methyltransferase RsmD
MRIISGIFKGRILKSPPGNLNVRPTTDRAKETLFNVLNNWFNFEDKGCLDLFCGTGNLGLEFMSRGGGMCTFVDLEIKTVKENVDLLNLKDKTEIIRNDALKYLVNNTGRKFDIAFADPPYKFIEYDNLIDAVSKYKMIFVVEHDKSFSAPDNYKDKMFLQKKIGISHFSFFDFK